MSDCKGCKYWTQAIDDYANGKHTDKEPNPFCSTCEGDKYQPWGAKETKAFLGAKIDAQAAEIKLLKQQIKDLSETGKVIVGALELNQRHNARILEALEKIDSLDMKNPNPDRPWKWGVMNKMWEEHAEMKRIAKQALLNDEG